MYSSVQTRLHRRGLGKRCVLNVSRTVVDGVLREYSDHAEVYFLNITASAPELTRRLLGRGRNPVKSRTALYICRVNFHRNYTGVRGNDFTALWHG
jgi:ribose 1,5-bisphosphokinase PhnN